MKSHRKNLISKQSWKVIQVTPNYGTCIEAEIPWDSFGLILTRQPVCGIALNFIRDKSHKTGRFATRGLEIVEVDAAYTSMNYMMHRLVWTRRVALIHIWDAIQITRSMRIFKYLDSLVHWELRMLNFPNQFSYIERQTRRQWVPFLKSLVWLSRGSNLRPSGSEEDALTTGPSLQLIGSICMLKCLDWGPHQFKKAP